jgi:hypothetical protein
VFPEAIEPNRVPVHVACIMDGNGRWAQRQGLPRTDGHAAGEEALFDTVHGALDVGLKWLTVYAFSSENWKRPTDEVRYLMRFNESLLLRRREEKPPGRLARWSENAFNKVVAGYGRSLRWALAFPAVMLLVFISTIGVTVYLYKVVPKGFFPQQDTGRLIGFVRADQSISFQAMKEKLDRFVAIVMEDPAVESVTAFTGGGTRDEPRRHRPFVGRDRRT